ncbi:MAG: type II secretion system F family protein [Hyphomonadaceae bacterium]|jgi:tight adherence protein C|nr:type II secretion system F family protein [Hyphomonadaceae bacterium]
MFHEVKNFAVAFTDPATVASFLLLAACLVTVLTVAVPLAKGDRLASRMKLVAANRDELRRKSRVALAEGQGALRKQDKGPWKRISDLLNLQKLLEDPNVVQKLTEAGLRGPAPVSIFYVARFATPIVFFLAALIYLFATGSELEGNMRLLVAVGACAIGFYLPNLVIANLAAKRRTSIMRAFPDALDLLLICVESGMSIEAAFQRVGAEIGSSSVELAEELSLTTAELNYLQDRQEAYQNLAKRTNHPGVKGVAMALTQAERYGTPLGSALRVMAKENREMRMTEAEKKAAALPAKLTVPMILFFLPVLFIVILTPAYIRWQQLQGAG